MFFNLIHILNNSSIYLIYNSIYFNLFNIIFNIISQIYNNFKSVLNLSVINRVIDVRDTVTDTE